MKERIINVASDLFSSIGYDKTTVSKIISELGISRGGFYHHFGSKEEILEEISIGYIKELEAFLESCYAEKDKDVIDTMNSVFLIVNQMKLQRSDNWDNVRRMYSFTGSHKIIMKMGIEFENVVSRFYEKLILQGNADGFFKASNPKSLSQLWTRELMKVYQEARYYVMEKSDLSIEAYRNHLVFLEEIITFALKCDTGIISIEEAGMSYLVALNEYYDQLIGG